MRSTTAAALTLVSGAHAFCRMPCRTETGVARMDPIVDPGQIADHVHTIAGSGSEYSIERLEIEQLVTDPLVKTSTWSPPTPT